MVGFFKCCLTSVYTKQLLSKPHLETMNTENFDVGLNYLDMTNKKQITNLDVTYCTNSNCPIKDKCARYLYQYDYDKNEYIWVSSFVPHFSPLNKIDCEHFSEIRDDEKY